MNKLSRQKERIVSILRDQKWHCGSEWLSGIKDDRIRISELNKGYMKEKGWKIVPEWCKGKYCGNKDCPLYARRAQKIGKTLLDSQAEFWALRTRAKKMCELFDAGAPSSVIFAC